MRYFLKLATIFGLASLSFSAFAEQYSCKAYGGAGCAEHLTDIVTDKFTAKYPVSKYEIVVVYAMKLMSDGGGVVFAVAGVSPKVSEAKYGSGKLALMPKNRYTSVRWIASGEKINPYLKTKHEIEKLRDAVESMMEDCDRDADCNILDMR